MTEKGTLNRRVQRIHRLEVGSATPKVIPKDIPVQGGESLKTTVLTLKLFLLLSVKLV